MIFSTTTNVLNVSACQQINNTYIMPWWFIPIIIGGIFLLVFILALMQDRD